MISETIVDHACQMPDAVAIVDDRRTLTYRELVWGGNVMADHYDALVPKAEFGDLVGLLMPPSAAFVVAFGACRWSNRIPLPLNYLLKPEELVAIARDAELRSLFTIEYFKPLAEAINAGLAAQGRKPMKIVYMESLKFERPGLMAMASIAANPANFAKHIKPFPERKPDDVAVIMYTSGSSGTPKGVMLTNRNLESNADDAIAHARFTRKTIFLGTLPMFHTLGLQGCFLIPLKLGSKVVYQARFSPVGVFELVAKHGIEVLIMVPTMYAVMAAAKSANRESLKGVNFCLSGGEPLPVTLMRAFEEKFGLPLYEGFGLTETSPIVAINTPWACKPGSVGRPIPDVQLKTVDENGQTVPIGVDGGELYIKGPNVMKGYYKKPELTAEVMTPDGWFKTGDIARIDQDGFLFITGRKKDMIIMAGEKVFPREIEDAIKQHPAILHAAVVGMKDEARGEMPVAFVQLKAELPAEEKPSAADIRAFVRDRIAPYKAPREVYFLEEMPKNATGKIQKRDLPNYIPKSE